MEYPVTSIRSGNDEKFGVWVSIGFRSVGRERHVLHIVGGEHLDSTRDPKKLAPIYCERDDQSLSCYEGADKITVDDNSVTIILNKVGRDGLELPRVLRFAVGNRLSGFKKARRVFCEMKSRKSGEIITVIDGSTAEIDRRD